MCGARRPRRPTPPGATRYDAGRQRVRPRRGVLAALPSPAQTRRAEFGLWAPYCVKGRKTSLKVPSRAPFTSPDLVDVGLAWSSLRGRTWPYGPPQPDCKASQQLPRANVQARAGDPPPSAARWGPGVSARRLAGKPPEQGLTSATPRAVGGREEVAPVPGAAPSPRPSRRASPRPVLGAAAAAEPSSAARGRVEPSSRPRRVAGLSAVRGRGRGRR